MHALLSMSQLEVLFPEHPLSKHVEYDRAGNRRLWGDQHGPVRHGSLFNEAGREVPAFSDMRQFFNSGL